MRPLPLVFGSLSLLALGFGAGLWLSSAGSTEAVAVSRPSSVPAALGSAAPGIERVVVADPAAAALRERVRELEAQLDGEASAGGEAEVLTVGKGTVPMHFGSDLVFDGSVGGELPPEVAERIAQAVEGALGGGELDCSEGDCVLLGPDGQPMEGVQIQTMGDFDPEQMGALLQEALGEGAILGEPQVGVMILEADVDHEAVAE